MGLGEQFSRVVGIVCFVPYVELQITGLGIILSVASFDAIDRTTAMLICVLPAMTDAQVAQLTRVMVVILGGISLWLAVFNSATLVSMLLAGYAGVTQFFPGVVLGLYWRRVKTAAVFSGLLIGVITAAVLMLGHHDPVFGMSAGFFALCVNFAITILFSLSAS